MKVGYRKPNLKKSVKARTTGKVKRQINKSINPTYGKSGIGWVNDPKKAAYNKVYNKTTSGINDSIKYNTEYLNNYDKHEEEKESIFSLVALIFKFIFSLVQVIFYLIVLGVILYFMFVIIF